METRISDLSSRAMLAGLSISVWRGQRFARQVTAEVNAERGAAHDAGRYNKHCLNKGDIAAITSAISGAKEAYYRLTSPWADSGMRILACENHDELVNAVEKARLELDAALREIAPRWPAIIEANRARLGAMFDPADYPADITSRYSVKLSRMAIPSGKDFRVDLDSEQLARAQAAIEADVREALENATRDVLNRMLPPVLAMAERLTKFRVIIGSDGKPRTENPFRDSLVGNLREIVRFLPSMNLTGNPQVAEMIDRIGELAARDPDEYRLGGRGGRMVREETARKAQSLAADVEAILATMGGNPDMLALAIAAE